MANARYWALLSRMSEMLETQEVDDAGEFTGRMVKHSADVWHMWAKRQFLGCEDTRLPSGRVVSIPHSTADLDVPAFNDFMTQVEVFANEHGAFLEDAKWSDAA